MRVRAGGGAAAAEGCCCAGLLLALGFCWGGVCEEVRGGFSRAVFGGRCWGQALINRYGM